MAEEITNFEIRVLAANALQALARLQEFLTFHNEEAFKTVDQNLLNILTDPMFKEDDNQNQKGRTLDKTNPITSPVKSRRS